VIFCWWTIDCDVKKQTGVKT